MPKGKQMSKPETFSSGSFKIHICLLVTLTLLSGCAYFNNGQKTFTEANKLFYQGDYEASLDKYSEIIKKYPSTADRALFAMGIAYAHPDNSQKDYQKSLECFQRLITDYPQSSYRQNSELMILGIRNYTLKDQLIAARQTQIEALRHEIQGRDTEIEELRKKIETLQKKNAALEKNIEANKQQLLTLSLQKNPIDKILIEKSKRTLTLISQGEKLKSYKIALGGNPIGHKERRGDQKTPEGIYAISGRNFSSQYHLSLRISYPNENDKKRARELGVSPGGDIMIHGIKNGFSWTDSDHSQVDWTEGCIAVTNKEIEEIARLTPDGTTVEILP